MSERLLTITQIADQFNLATGLLYEAVARGEIPVVRFRPRGRIRLRERDVHEWIERHRSQPHSRSQCEIQASASSASTGADIDHLLPPRELRRFAH